MKTKFFNQQSLRICLSTFLSPWFLSQEERRLLATINNRKKTCKSLKNEKPSRLQKSLSVLVDRVAAVQNSKLIAKELPRFITELFLLVWVAPFADSFYTNLDVNDRVPADVWYYESWNWYFLCIGPYLKNIFTVVGLYLIFVRKNSVIKTAAASFPMMYDIGKIIWLSLVKNHDEYNMLTPKMFLVYGFITSVFLIYMIDLLSYWFNHRVIAIKARFQGLRSIAFAVSADQFRDKVVETMDASDNVNQFQS